MSLARVQAISISLDGFATGEGQSLDARRRPSLSAAPSPMWTTRKAAAADP